MKGLNLFNITWQEYDGYEGSAALRFPTSIIYVCYKPKGYDPGLYRSYAIWPFVTKTRVS